MMRHFFLVILALQGVFNLAHAVDYGYTTSEYISPETSSDGNVFVVAYAYVGSDEISSEPSFDGVVRVKTLYGDDVLKADFMQARFGPDLSKENTFVGRVYVPDPPDACTEVSPLNSSAIEDNDMPIALVLRKTCIFQLKVLNAQKAGYKAVIVYNNVTGVKPLVMGPNNDSWVHDINIPSLMISYTDGLAIKSTYVCQPSRECRYKVSLQVNTHLESYCALVIPPVIIVIVVIAIAIAIKRQKSAQTSQESP